MTDLTVADAADHLRNFLSMKNSQQKILQFFSKNPAATEATALTAGDEQIDKTLKNGNCSYSMHINNNAGDSLRTCPI